jgi:hypothetical protein
MATAGDCAPDRKPAASPQIEAPPIIPPVHADRRVNAKNIAELIKRGHMPAARKLAQDVARRMDEFYDIAELYQRRNKVGLGWGSQPQPVSVQDGLERMLLVFSRGVPVAALNSPGNNEEAALWIAALAQLTYAMPPKKDGKGGKTRVAWLKWSDELSDASLELRRASAENNPQAMQKAAAKTLAVCNQCHIVFRD